MKTGSQKFYKELMSENFSEKVTQNMCRGHVVGRSLGATPRLKQSVVFCQLKHFFLYVWHIQ